MGNTIFEVDVKGFKELYSGKPKWLIVRELIANALDENITECRISFAYEGRKATIIVEDDSPEGFLDLSDSFTLFRTTRKRSNPNVRGRFNMGEKESLCLCEYARIITTTGAVEFDMKEEKRTTLRRKRDKGSEVMIVVKMTSDEYASCLKYCSQILMPKDIKFFLNIKNEGDAHLPSDVPKYSYEYKEPFKNFTSKLKTELKDGESGEMRSVTRETEVHIHDKKFTGDVSYIFELGIPICEIDCQYSVDVQQKVPLSTDRDKVDGKYLKTIYAEVLNQVFDEVKEDQASSTWVRSAIETGNVSKEAVESVVEERFGDKVVIANPFDPISIDDALSNGYRVVYGNEMSKEEWATIRGNGAMISSSDKFKTSYGASENVTPSKQQLKVFSLVKRIGECMGFNPLIDLIKCKGATVLATFTLGGTSLTFYDNTIPKDWWEPDENGFIKDRMLDLIIHELCHKYGMHCDRTYLDAITKNGAMLVKRAIEQKSFFKIN